MFILVHGPNACFFKIFYRPKLDAENRLGHTALSWAAIKDRLAQMDALVQRGATVQR